MADYSKILKNDWSVTTKTLFAWIVVGRDAKGQPKRLGAAGAVYLSQIHFWRGVYARPFHKTWWELQLETGLNREEQKTARKRLGDLVKTFRRRPRLAGNKIGDAPVVHYDLDYARLALLLSEAADDVSAFIAENGRLGEEPQSDWVQAPIPIGAVDPRSKNDSTSHSTSDSTLAAEAASSQDTPSLSLAMGHSPDPGSSQAKKKNGQGGRGGFSTEDEQRILEYSLRSSGRAVTKEEGRPPDSGWWALQRKHLKSFSKSNESVTADEFCGLIDSFLSALRAPVDRRPFWAKDRKASFVDPTSITTKMLPYLREWSAAVPAFDGMAHFRAEIAKRERLGTNIKRLA